MNSEMFACHFGGPPKQRESAQARESRMLQGQQTDIDARRNRLRMRLQDLGRTRSSLLGSSEGASLGAGL